VTHVARSCPHVAAENTIPAFAIDRMRNLIEVRAFKYVDQREARAHGQPKSR
jgi:hypothetical protein